mmetsp:Transcript_45847/g.146287  ORF Transcript_45847/g.146287 Transcript_45847/m.146287 type:complete len:301 (-) Transcript_45847:726-1628(-)
MERSIVHVGPGGRAAAAHATSSVPSRAALFLRTGGSFPPRAGRGIPRAHADRSVKLSARTAGEGVGEASAGESVPRAPSYSAVATGVAAEGRERKLHPVQAHGPGSALVTFDCDVLEGRFVLEADEVEEICEECELTPIQLMRSLIGQAQKMAIPPISDFYVGAVGMGVSGRIYIGVNVEFQRVPLLQSIHAEQFLVCNALRCGERQLKYIALSAAPCGHCRQFCCELYGADELQFLFRGNPADSLSHLLPWRFGPSDLQEPSSGKVQLLLEDRANGLALGEGEVARACAAAGVEQVGDD